MRFTAAWTVLSFSIGAIASAIPRGHVTLRDVWRFPTGTWVENIAVRSNGKLLVTLLSQPDVYQVNPSGTESPSLVYSFPGASGALGIAELGTDVFAVVAGNWSTTTFTSTPRSKTSLIPIVFC
jgi:hypothetical protein